MLVLPLLLAAAALAQTEGVTVSGRGVVYGEPDRATLELGVTAVDPDPGAAVQQVNERSEQVIAALLEAGLEREAIRTSLFNVWREERFAGPDEPVEPAQYRAQHMLVAQVDDPQRVGEVLAAAIDAGADVVGGVTFSIEDRAALEAQARALAVADARERAEQLAAETGVRLGLPVSIEEGALQGPVGPLLERSAVALDAVPVAPGQLGVEVGVVIRYALHPQ